MNYNMTLLAGRIATQPEYKEVGDKRLAKFRLAVSAFWRDKEGEANESTQFFTITCWNGVAKRVEDYNVGDTIFVEGRLKESQWKGKDEQPRRSTEVVAHRVKMVRRKRINTEEILQAALNDPTKIEVAAETLTVS